MQHFTNDATISMPQLADLLQRILAQFANLNAHPHCYRLRQRTVSEKKKPKVPTLLSFESKMTDIGLSTSGDAADLSICKGTGRCPPCRRNLTTESAIRNAAQKCVEGQEREEPQRPTTLSQFGRSYTY